MAALGGAAPAMLGPSGDARLRQDEATEVFLVCVGCWKKSFFGSVTLHCAVAKAWYACRFWVRSVEDSLSEHQPPTWPSYFMDINLLAFLVPVGIENAIKLKYAEKKYFFL